MIQFKNKTAAELGNVTSLSDISIGFCYKQCEENGCYCVVYRLITSAERAC
jgi:hypothetical protein